jgi:hypothetical protein
MNCDEKGKIALDPRDLQHFSSSPATVVELDKHKEGVFQKLWKYHSPSAPSEASSIKEKEEDYYGFYKELSANERCIEHRIQCNMRFFVCKGYFQMIFAILLICPVVYYIILLQENIVYQPYASN